jgi:hypothetical protein
MGPEPSGSPQLIYEGDLSMADEFTAADVPSIQPGDPDEKSARERVAERGKAAGQGVNRAIETGREPGMPLDIVSKMVREAPLHSLVIAFLLGMAISRPR